MTFSEFQCLEQYLRVECCFIYMYYLFVLQLIHWLVVKICCVTSLLFYSYLSSSCLTCNNVGIGSLDNLFTTGVFLVVRVVAFWIIALNLRLKEFVNLRILVISILYG